MSRSLLIVLTAIVFIGCSDSAPPELPDPRVVAIAESLETFHGQNNSIGDEVIYVKPGEFVEAVPLTLGGKPVEIIERDHLLKKIGRRETAPCYTIYVIGNDLPEFDFYVSVSVSGAGGFDQFEEIPYGGEEIYCYVVENGVPKVQKVIGVEY